MTIEEKEKLIGEFMNPDWEKLCADDYDGSIPNERLWQCACLCSKDYKYLKYRSSWDNLMKVVEKVESIQLPSPCIIPVKVVISRHQCQVYYGKFHDPKEGSINITVDERDSRCDKKHAAVYDAMISFILYYNKLKSEENESI